MSPLLKYCVPFIERLPAPASRLGLLAPHTPELLPAERLWPLTDEAVANRPFETVEDLADTLDRRCPALADDPETIRPTTRFNRYPAECIIRNPYQNFSAVAW